MVLPQDWILPDSGGSCKAQSFEFLLNIGRLEWNGPKALLDAGGGRVDTAGAGVRSQWCRGWSSDKMPKEHFSAYDELRAVVSGCYKERRAACFQATRRG